MQSAVTASTVTNLAAVVPFLLISGLAALIFRELILTISFAILASLLVALTVVPMLAAQPAKIRFSSHLTGFARSRPRSWARQVRNAYVRSATTWVVKGRWAVLGIAVLALVASLFATRRLGNEFLPQVDDGNVSISISLPPGASAEETNRLPRWSKEWSPRCRTSSASSRPRAGVSSIRRPGERGHRIDRRRAGPAGRPHHDFRDLGAQHAGEDSATRFSGSPHLSVRHASEVCGHPLRGPQSPSTSRETTSESSSGSPPI
ncbi:MAG: efflux RND transporter permease subunit [Candidatus Eisenbacteria bacterium]